MCGIWALFGYDTSNVQRYASAFEIAHRGPDCYHLQNITRVPSCSMAFFRLCVVDNVRGMQVSSISFTLDRDANQLSGIQIV